MNNTPPVEINSIDSVASSSEFEPVATSGGALVVVAAAPAAATELPSPEAAVSEGPPVIMKLRGLTGALLNGPG